MKMVILTVVPVSLGPSETGPLFTILQSLQNTAWSLPENVNTLLFAYV